MANKNLNYIEVILKYFEIFKERFFIALKQFKEYKMNTMSVLIVDITLFIIYIIFFNIFSSVVPFFEGWKQIDFVTYYLLGLLEWKLLWTFCIANFRITLINGELNSYLTKPVSTFFMIASKNLNSGTIISTLFLFGALTISFIIGDYSNYLFAFCSIIFGMVFFSMYYSFAETLAFFMKDNEFVIDIFHRIAATNKRFTPTSFNGLKYNLFFLLPTSVTTYFSLLILKGNFLILDYLFGLIIFFLILFIGTILNWKRGLKSYEAFG